MSNVLGLLLNAINIEPAIASGVIGALLSLIITPRVVASQEKYRIKQQSKFDIYLFALYLECCIINNNVLSHTHEIAGKLNGNVESFVCDDDMFSDYDKLRNVYLRKSPDFKYDNAARGEKMNDAATVSSIREKWYKVTAEGRIKWYNKLWRRFTKKRTQTHS